MVNITAGELHSWRGNLKILNLGDIGSSWPGVKSWDQRSQCLLQNIVFIPSPSRKTLLLRSEVKRLMCRVGSGEFGQLGKTSSTSSASSQFQYQSTHTIHTNLI